MNYIKRKLKTTTGLFTIIMCLSILVLGVSYATFVITTDKYKASEMLISNLTYGINITGDGNSIINGKTVNVGANKATTLQVKITSLNDISSNYSLEYKILSGSGKVTFASGSTFTPTGDINKTGTEKTVIVIIQASSAMSIEFNVAGGYTYNGTPSTLTGYTKITEYSHYLTVTSTNTNYGTISNGYQIISNNGTAVITLTPKSGYEYSSNTCGGTISGNTLTIKNITTNKTCTVSFVKSIPDFTKKLLADNPTILTRTDFSNAFTDSNTGTLYKASGNETEDGSDVYYFAGNAQNNWVKFGKDQDNADLYWRIIRTNEDGSLRLLYVGPDPATTKAFIKIDGKYMEGGSSDTTGKYNSYFKYGDAYTVGYMYGSSGSLANNRANTTNSNIKLRADEWYSKTINVKTDGTYTYDKYVSRTAIYCNDRSGDGYKINTGNDFIMYFAAYNRLDKNKIPSYKCGSNLSRSLYNDANVADKFSASTTKGGNGRLAYPIALMTADEIVYAGGRYNASAATWYYYNNGTGSAVGDDSWWTMTPYRAAPVSNYEGNNYGYVYYILNGRYFSGELRDAHVFHTTPGLRPVLSLKSCVKVISGNGSSSTPYQVSVDSVCAAAEN